MKMMLYANKLKGDLKYPEDFINKIIHGDCLELIKLIPNNSVDVVLIDPPYGLNKNGIRGDTDLNIFYSILPECYRVLKKDSFFITFFSTKF
jgi:DNA modification methylase